MKTSELIRRLQKEDPSGEAHVVVGNVDIFCIEMLPAYYDGAAQELIRDPAKSPYYNISGGKYKRSGEKLQIHTMSISDALFDNANLPIDYSELSPDRQVTVKQAHDQLRKFVGDINNKLEYDTFKEWVKDKASKLMEDLEDLDGISWQFFENNMSSDTPIPKDISEGSYNSRRKEQWNRELVVELKEGFLSIRKVLDHKADIVDFQELDASSIIIST